MTQPHSNLGQGAGTKCFVFFDVESAKTSSAQLVDKKRQHEGGDGTRFFGYGRLIYSVAPRQLTEVAFVRINL